MKRALITGATGFVGANLARRLLREGHEVHLLVRPGYNPWRIAAILPEIELHEVSLDDPAGLERVIKTARPDWIFHLAVYGAYSTQTDLSRIVQTNITGTINLLGASLKSGFEAFINTGSSSEYGYKDYPPTETEWLDPNSHYAWTKAAATHYCRYTAQSQGLNITTLRLYSVYGPYEEPTRLIPALILRGLHGEWPPLVNPDIARDYIYIEDVENAFLLAASNSAQEAGAVYNVGTGVQTSLREITAVAGKVLGIEFDPQWGSMPPRGWDTATWVADSHKLQTALGWQPSFGLEEGFRRTVEWLQNNLTILGLYYSMPLG